MAELNLTFDTDALRGQKLYVSTKSIAVFHDYHNTVVFTDVGHFVVQEFPEDVIAQFSNQECYSEEKRDG